MEKTTVPPVFKSLLESFKDPESVKSFRDQKHEAVKRKEALGKDLYKVCERASMFTVDDLARILYDLSKSLLDLRPQLDSFEAYDELLGVILSEKI